MLEPLEEEAPVTPVCTTVQENVVPVTELVSAIDVALPEQMVADDGVAVTAGFGFTVTVTETGVPVQPPAEGVMVYTTVPAVVPVAVSVCAMLVPLPAVAPVAPVWVTVQLNVVLPIELVSAMEVALPEQMDCEEGVAVATGTGLTVIVCDCVALQVPEPTVYVTVNVPAPDVAGLNVLPETPVPDHVPPVVPVTSELRLIDALLVHNAAGAVHAGLFGFVTVMFWQYV